MNQKSAPLCGAAKPTPYRRRGQFEEALRQNAPLPSVEKMPVDKPVFRRRLRDVVQDLMYFSDEEIAKYFKLGCKVKALGRGHIQRIKEQVRAKRK